MRNFFKLICLCFTALLLFTAAENSCAQQADTVKIIKPATIVKAKKQLSVKDSTRRAILKRSAIIRSFKHSDGVVNDLLDKIDTYTSGYNDKMTDLDHGFDTLEISQRLGTLERRMALMKTTINNSNTMGYLVTIRDLIDHVGEQTKEWQDRLNTYSDKLDTTRQCITQFNKDTTFDTEPQDSVLQIKIALQIYALRKKWDRLDSASQKAVIRIGIMANRVSSLSILLIDLDNRIDDKIHDFTLNALENEYGFIWDMHKKNSSARLDTAVVKTYALNSKLYKYFFINKTNYYGHLGSILLLIGFFAWIYSSKSKLARVNENYKTAFDQTHYIVKHPYLTTVAVFALIAPYFYDHPALIFTQTMLIIMMASIGSLIKTNWPKPLFKFWQVLMVLVVIFSISGLMILTTNIERILLLLLSIWAIYAAFQLLKYLKRKPDGYPPYLSIAIKIFVFVQSVAFLLNVAGRFSISKIAGSMAVFNLCLAMGFYLLVQILMEGLFLQLEANKKTDNTSVASYLEFKVLQKKFKDAIVNITALLWLVALAKNLVIDDYLYDNISDFLNNHQVSSTAFTFKSILVFVFVIWVSGILARIISYFYDFTAQQTKLTPEAKKTRSSILLIRLTIFIIGFFIAINAAGIPLSQVTLIIGALGVGIGFGLQNLVNNLVSGIILAFEKPIQVGDVIEVANKSGTIIEIGIRSSKISCGDGSELIVPNGDLISQHVVNWTLSDNNRRIELIIRVEYGSDVTKVQEILHHIIDTHDDIMKLPKPSVYLHNFSESSIDFRMFFWASDLSTWLSLKSSVLSEIYARFAKEGIEIPHGKNDIQLSFPEGAEQEIKKAAAVKKTSKLVKGNPKDQDQ
ncbi:mechanosensitive ion channel [Mucilaginibacter sp. HMF5004]|uniref:mechanosensitive ion channel family protein n=1 Tax=Mucilaginibacter rivuli TaxID=2857527 RepID=UPI001C5F0DB3|nr:mechanosensitive ion channel domain-containing protein [Mucilaginibacter rivuli]MBW4891649.1 mechanosensitive ion channel [Mucilaginibacter rivuli]